MQTTDETKASVNVEVELKPATAPRQLDMLGMLTGKIGDVMLSKPITNKDGVEVGTAIGMRKMKEIAVEQGLEGKDNRAELQAFIDKTGNTAMRHLLVNIMAMGDKFTLKRSRSARGKDGLLNVSFGIKEIKQKAGPTDEEIAKAWGFSVGAVKLMRERQEAALKEEEAKTVDA